jgi:hypothetical protein
MRTEPNHDQPARLKVAAGQYNPGCMLKSIVAARCGLLLITGCDSQTRNAAPSSEVKCSTARARIIADGLKKCGMILADNGGDWFISGAPDARWTWDDNLEMLRRIKGRDFEVVKMGAMITRTP